MAPDVDLLAELDAVDTCWCDRPVEECEEAGGCRWTRALADLERQARARAAGEFEAYRCDYNLCGMCTCRADLVKLLRGDS